MLLICLRAGVVLCLAMVITCLGMASALVIPIVEHLPAVVPVSVHLCAAAGRAVVVVSPLS